MRAQTDHNFDNDAVSGSVSILFAAALGVGFNYTNSEARALVNGSVEVDAGALNVIADTDAPYSSSAIGLAARS